MKRSKNKKTGRVVLITGETSGFGFETAKLFIKNGDIVCGFSRHDFSYEGIFHQVGDVSKEEDCKACIKGVVEKYDRIDILVNNAGLGIFGPVEETPLEKVKKQIDVTFYGAYLMTKATLPFMRENIGGRIINISSIGGVIPLPFQAFYSASKAAMDTLFDALRTEVYPYNIQITSIKPGDAKTNFTTKRDSDSINENSVYKPAFDRSLEMVSKDEQHGFEPIKIAKTVLKVSQKRKAPYFKSVGAKDRFLATLYRILPKRLRNYLMYKIYAS